MATKTKPRVIEIPNTVKVNADEIGVAYTNGNGHGPKVTLKPIRKRMKPLERLFTKAIDALKEHGWITGGLGEEEIGFCLVGAVQFAANGDATISTKESNRAINHMSKFLPREFHSDDPEHAVISFNDGRATRGKALSLLRRALKAVR